MQYNWKYISFNGEAMATGLQSAQKSMDATRSISTVIVDSFKNLESKAAELCRHVDESHAAHDRSLAELAESYEVGLETAADFDVISGQVIR